MSIQTSTFLNQRIAKLIQALMSVDSTEIDRAVEEILITTKYKFNIFTCGNGASASIAQHLACDYTKGSYSKEFNLGPKVISLSDNVPLITAIGNDISFDEIYSYQLRRLAQTADTLFVISSSGQSPNIIKTIEAAKDIGITTIAMTGFNGGRVKELADINIHVKTDEYELTEDCHSFIMQSMAKMIREKISEYV